MAACPCRVCWDEQTEEIRALGGHGVCLIVGDVARCQQGGKQEGSSLGTTRSDSRRRPAGEHTATSAGAVRPGSAMQCSHSWSRSLTCPSSGR